jgi:hypothetical protein
MAIMIALGYKRSTKRACDAADQAKPCRAGAKASARCRHRMACVGCCADTRSWLAAAVGETDFAGNPPGQGQLHYGLRRVNIQLCSSPNHLVAFERAAIENSFMMRSASLCCASALLDLQPDGLRLVSMSRAPTVQMITPRDSHDNYSLRIRVLSRHCPGEIDFPHRGTTAGRKCGVAENI